MFVTLGAADEDVFPEYALELEAFMLEADDEEMTEAVD